MIEKSETNCGAYVPDLPGCIAVAKTKKEVERLIAEAISLHLESLIKHGDPVPPPSSEVEYIEPLATS